MSAFCHSAFRLVLGVGILCASTGCGGVQLFTHNDTPRKAFITYTPPAQNSGRLRLAVKDLIDVKGTVTTAGSEYISKNTPPAARDAKCMDIARARGVEIVGKTNLSEFALSPSGLNRYFGTPKNPLSQRSHLIPGGSSSGSAVAVATGLADVAFGTDTAGSVRVPAACCGVVGLKTTYGLVSMQGVFPIVPKYLDTIGPLGKDIAHTVQGMDLLEAGFEARYRSAVASRPSGGSIRIGRLYLDGTDPKIDAAIDENLHRAGFKVVRLDDRFKAAWIQADADGTTVAAGGAWETEGGYLDKPGVASRTKAALLAARVTYGTTYPAALQRRIGWKRELRRVFKKVDFVAVPTLQTLPPRVPFFGAALFEAQILATQNTEGVDLAGVPALAVPIPVDDKRVPLTSVQLVGPWRSEAGLLNAGRLIEAAGRLIEAARNKSTPGQGQG